MNYNLSDLLAQKSFNDLTVKERRFVRDHISKAEYEQKRSVILGLKDAMQEESAQLNPVFPAAAFAALKEKQEEKEKKGLWFIFSHKIPTWAAVAAGLLVYLLVGQVGTKTSGEISHEITLVHDTVYVEKFLRSMKQPVLPKANLIVRNDTTQTSGHAMQQVTKAQEQKKKEVIYTDEMLAIGSANYISFLSSHNSANGVSLKNDSLSQLVNRTVF